MTATLIDQLNLLLASVRKKDRPKAQYLVELSRLSKQIATLPNKAAAGKIVGEVKTLLKATKSSNLPKPVAIDASLPSSSETGSMHPITELICRLEKFFYGRGFTINNDSKCVETTVQAFDSLLIAPEHPSRLDCDTFYLPDGKVLRPHTSSSQTRLLKQNPGHFKYAYWGDVYRRDSVDSTHNVKFYQLEILWVDNSSTMIDLLTLLRDVVYFLFGPIETRVRPTTFPFTTPSAELDIKYKGEWLEVIGCGLTCQQILQSTNHHDHIGLAAGLGLDRLAMINYDITDIRAFYRNCPDFLRQFKTRNVKI